MKPIKFTEQAFECPVEKISANGIEPTNSLTRDRSTIPKAGLDSWTLDKWSSKLLINIIIG